MIGVLVFVMGTVIGSFMNVCIYRIPAGESIVTGRSHCTSCKTNIKWYDLVPVLSYLILGGRCRYCKAPISERYPLIELINGICWLVLYGIFGLNLAFFILSVLASVILVTTFIIYDKHRH